jgi:uncharacterized repeat protein (TIGR02543 family)
MIPHLVVLFFVALISFLQVGHAATFSEASLRGRLSMRAPTARDTFFRLRPHEPSLGIGFEETRETVSSLKAPPCFEWNTLTAGESLFRFSPRVYDPVRKRAILFGGGSHGGLKNDVWVYDLDSNSGWTQVATMGPSPRQRWGHGAIYDPVRDRLVIFGGYGVYCDKDIYDTCNLNDVWALSLSGIPTWQQISTTGSSPQPRGSHAVIYDPIRDRMIVSGGTTEDGFFNDTWALSLATSTWTELPPGPQSTFAGAFHDLIRDRMVLVDGLKPGAVWTLDLSDTSRWIAVEPSGPLPAQREGSAYAYDPVRDRILMFGGESPSLWRNDLWELTLSDTPSWNQLSASNAPPPRWNSTGIYDETRDQMVIFGGGSINAYADTWVLPLAGPLIWSRLFPGEFTPTPRSEQATVWDGPRQRMIVFGGQGPEGASLNDAYALSVAGTPDWTRINAMDSLPDRRASMTAIADTHDRMIVFGGRSDERFARGYKLFNDVWALSLSGPPVWTALAPSGPSPVGRTNACAIHDPVRDRMIVFGGVESTDTSLNETWALDLTSGTAWHQLAPAGSAPPPMVASAAVYDPVRDRMLVIGGYLRNVGPVNTVWALSLTGSGEWTLLSPAGAVPPPMYEASAVYDAQRDRVLVYGDASAPGQVDVLSLAGTPAWSAASIVGNSPVARVEHGAAFDPASDRMVVFGGANWEETVYLNDAVALSVPSNASPLEISISPLEGGTVTRDPKSGCYANGSSVTLMAIPASGYEFTGWTGDATGDANPLTITIDAAKNIVANFDSFTTATLVSRFVANLSQEGIELRWHLGAPELVMTLNLERATTGAGPWHIVTAEPRQELGVSIVMDRDIESGLEYWYRLRLTMHDGATFTSEPISTKYEWIQRSDITAVAPNPSFGSSQVHFEIAHTGHVRLTVVDVGGRQVATLLDAERKPGRYVVDWDTRKEASVRAGIYFVRLSTSDRAVVREITIVE